MVSIHQFRLTLVLLATVFIVFASACVEAKLHHKKSHHAKAAPAECLGEFEACPLTGECVLISDFCGQCTVGEYLCPDGQTCVQGPSGYLSCPNITGTHLDWTLSVDERIAYFLSAATLDQKIQQLQNQAPAIPELGLPFYNWLNDDVHSVNQPHATVFPDGCGLGATWNKQTLFNVGYLIGNEARATHNGLVHEGDRGFMENAAGITTYAPNLNLVRDPRWGRNQEVYSEDPYLTARLTVAYVNGQQGSNETETKYMMAGSCCKHYAAYDVESIPVDRYHFDAQVPTRDFWESYLPAFEACVVEAQATSVMCSYNSMNGVPTCGDPNLLNGILRGRWNFTGFVVSDYDAWANLVTTHHECADMTCAAAVGIKAGMDQEGGGSAAIDAMGAAVQSGNVTEADVDTALSRLLRVRIGLGMLDPPTLNPWNQLSNTTVETPGHLNIAREVARESICLYKNNDTLPLNPASFPDSIRLALIGPQHVDPDLLYGNYAREPDFPGVTSILQGAFDVLNLELPCTQVQDYDYYQPGQLPILTWSPEECQAICSSYPSCQYYTFYQNGCYLKSTNAGGGPSTGRISGQCKQQTNVQFAFGCDDILCADNTSFPQAIATASTATHIVVTLGLDARTIETEGHDRSDINLPGYQYSLVSTLRQSMQPGQLMICVFIHGGTFALDNLWQDCDAIVDTWYPGQVGGAALWDVLFGYYNPAGRTPATWYVSNSDLPPMEMMSWYPNTTQGTNGISYRFFTQDVEIPFGFGLSYTTFEYINLQLNATSYLACDFIEVSFTVTNTGSMDGDEVVQVYLNQLQPSVPAPYVQLVGFDRVHIAAGASVNLSYIIEPKWHSVVVDPGTNNFWQPTRLVEAQPLRISVGGGQPAHANVISTEINITTASDLDAC